MSSPASAISGGGGGGSIPDLGTDAAFSGDNETYLTAAPSTATRNLVQPTSPAVSSLVLKGAASQSADIVQIVNSAGTVVASFRLGQVLAPAGTAALPGVASVSFPDTGVVWPSSGVVAFSFQEAVMMEFRYNHAWLYRDDAWYLVGGNANFGLGYTSAALGRLAAGKVGLGGLIQGRPVEAKTANFAIADTDSNKVYTNAAATGSVTATLPAATVANGIGPCYDFVVLAAQSFVLQVQGGEVLRVGTSTTSAGGTATSNAVGSRLQAQAVATGVWSAIVSNAWTLA